MKEIFSIRSLVEEFDTFILDQWGVLHNGATAFDPALEALTLLKKKQKKVAILTNSGKSQDYNRKTLHALNITQDLYSTIVTAGDHMRKSFKTGKFANLGIKAFLLPWNDQKKSDIPGIKIVFTALHEADFVLCTGVNRHNVQSYIDDLKTAKNLHLPLVVSNPDFVSVDSRGCLHMCPGAIAKCYEDMGGVVFWHGKPTKDVYAMCHDAIDGWHNAVIIGDSLYHDIGGANAIGAKSIFVTDGIHKKKCQTFEGIQALTRQYNVYPTYYMSQIKV